jgi:phenylglyoxylate dehydrogenase epsilon subunit
MSGPPAIVRRPRVFYTDAKIMNAILPDATEQGRIAGMAMAEDPGLKKYPGGVPLNTYHFFGPPCDFRWQQQGARGRRDGDPVRRSHWPLPEGDFQCRQPADGIYGVNEFFDGGVMCQLILRRIDLSPVKERFLANPLAVGRELMSKTWR